MQLTFSQRRRIMLWQMLPHMLLGHPIAAILSRIGLWKLCELWHWYTLTPRARRKIGNINKIDYDHDPSVFWIDFFFAPITHLFGAFGFHYLGFKIYMLGPLEAALNHSTHFNFLLWGIYSPDLKEQELANELLKKGRCRRAELISKGHPRWPTLFHKE